MDKSILVGGGSADMSASQHRVGKRWQHGIVGQLVFLWWQFDSGYLWNRWSEQHSVGGRCHGVGRRPQVQLLNKVYALVQLLFTVEVPQVQLIIKVIYILSRRRVSSPWL